MNRYIATLATTLLLTLTLAPKQAAGQTLNMDMSWGIRNQMMYQAQGNAYARAAAQAYYNYMLRLRAMGYTGPSLPTGVTAQSLQAANQRLQQSYDAYNRSSAINSQRTSNAINDWDMRAIRGCSVGIDAYGNRKYYCP
jgi:hypothetical protein